MSSFNISIASLLFNESCFNINVFRCGQENCNKKKMPEAGIRPYNSIHFITHGRGNLVVNDKCYPLKKGQCFIIFNKDDNLGSNGTMASNCYYPDKTDPWSYIWIDFLCDNARDLFEKCGFTEEPFITVKSWEYISKQFNNLMESYDFSEVQNLYSSAYFLLLISKLAEDHVKLLAHYRGKDPHKFRYVRDAIIFMNNNYRIKITLKDVAENVGVSPTHLVAVFADEMDFSPMLYLTLFRIARACELLRLGRYNVSEVSNQVGFSDSLYFSRCFSKVKGMSPRQYMQSKPTEDPYAFFKERKIDF